MIRRDDRLDLTRRQRRREKAAQQQQQQQRAGPVDVDAFYDSPTSPQRQLHHSQPSQLTGRSSGVAPQHLQPHVLQRSKSAPKPRQQTSRVAATTTTTPIASEATAPVRYTTPTNPFARHQKQPTPILKPSQQSNWSAPRNPDVRRLPGSGEETAVYYHRESGVGFRPPPAGTNTHPTNSESRIQAAAARYYASRVMKQQQQQQQQPTQRPFSPGRLRSDSPMMRMENDTSMSSSQGQAPTSSPNQHHPIQRRVLGARQPPVRASSPPVRASSPPVRATSPPVRAASPLVRAISATDANLSRSSALKGAKQQSNSFTTNDQTSSTATTFRSDDDRRSWTTTTASFFSDPQYTNQSSLLDEAAMEDGSIPILRPRRHSEGRVMVDPNGDTATAIDEIAKDMIRRQQYEAASSSGATNNTPDGDDDEEDLPASKYSRAIQHLAHQDTAIQMLQEQLHETKLNLAQTKKELQQSQSEVARRSHAMEQSSHETFQQRINLEERLRNVMKINQEHETEVAQWKQRVERLEEELRTAEDERNKTVEAVVVDQEDSHQKAEEARQMIEQLQSQVANLHNEKRSIERTLEEVTSSRDKAQTNASQMARELVMMNAEADRWKKEATLWKKRSGEADALRTQLSAVRAVLGSTSSMPSPSSTTSNRSKEARRTVLLTRDHGATATKVVETRPAVINVSMADVLPDNSHLVVDDKQAEASKGDTARHQGRGSPFFVGDVVNVSASTAETEALSLSMNENDDDQRLDSKQERLDRMLLSLRPSFDAPMSQGSSGHGEQDRTQDEIEEEEIQDLLQQLSRMKQTVSMSHSSETIEPPPDIRRNRSTTSIFSSDDAEDYATRSAFPSLSYDMEGNGGGHCNIQRSGFSSDEDSEEGERISFRRDFDSASF